MPENKPYGGPEKERFDKEEALKKIRQMQKDKQNRQRWNVFFWIFITALIAFNLFRVPEQEHYSIAYSEFKNELRTDNVKSVTFRQSIIQGMLRNPIQPEGQPEAITQFQTFKPAVTDQGLMALLEEKNVFINAQPPSSPGWMYLIVWLPWLLFIGYFIYAGIMVRKQLNGSSRSSSGGVFGIGRSRAKRYRIEKNKINFQDVAGLENAKKDLREITEYMKNQRKFLRLGAKIPKGILLMGPPGVGKTMLARATAGEVGIPFFSISGSEFIEMFVGVGASRVRDMFSEAKREAPAIIFIDELDSIGRTRGAGLGGGHDEREQTLNQILSEMDGFEPHELVVVLAATNRPDVLDPALIRPGRFDRQITLELPEKEAREQILKIHSKDVPLAEDVDFKNISARTVGYSGADLRNLVNEASLLAGRSDKKKVDMEEFEKARDKILLGMEREEKIDEDEKKIIAYHEAGHALASKLLPNADPLQKVTIIPRGRSLGSTEQIPEIERHNYTKEYLLDLISVRLAGRAAERLVFDTITNGASDDFKNVTKIAQKMVCQWGMSERLGPAIFKLGEEHVFLGREIVQPKDFSEHTARIIDEEIKSILIGMEQRAFDVLKDNREKLDDLARVLLEKETLTSSEVEYVIGNGKVGEEVTAGGYRR